VKIKQIVLFYIAIVATVAIVFSACRKINEATELGGDLVPPVDNINTFDTTVDVQTFNDTFGLANDSQYLARSEEHFLGLINSDNIFGRTDARIFLELKPTQYGTYPFARRDSVKIDSIVLVLDYLETYGDTNVAQAFKVYEIDNASNFKYDSAYLIRKENVTYNTAFPLSKPGQFFTPKFLNDTVKAFRDTTINQLRIKLDTAFARRLFNYDTANAYKSDSAFRSAFKGFAIRAEGSGNAIMGFNLGGANTKLAIYYNNPKTTASNGGVVRDTSVGYFYFTQLSAAANYIKRDYTGSQAFSPLNNGTSLDPVVFLQNSPGTYANIKIPGLTGISNRVVHRAELIVEQLYDISDSTFLPPNNLYLDAFDNTITSNKKFRSVPYDLTYQFDQPQNLAPFGVIPAITTDGSGNKIRTWKFNISRYLQHVFTKTATAYDLRLYAPFTVSNKYILPAPSNDPSSIFNLNPSVAKGRIRVLGSTGPGDTNPRRMRIHIIYSKL
jgi:Domain of unknown function (DUF4270)